MLEQIISYNNFYTKHFFPICRAAYLLLPSYFKWGAYKEQSSKAVPYLGDAFVLIELREWRPGSQKKNEALLSELQPWVCLSDCLGFSSFDM